MKIKSWNTTNLPFAATWLTFFGSFAHDEQVEQISHNPEDAQCRHYDMLIPIQEVPGFRVRLLPGQVVVSNIAGVRCSLYIVRSLV